MPLLASYSFIPWVRRGVATRITRVEGTPLAQPEPRASLTFDVGFNAGALTASIDLNLAGSGEVSSLDPRAVIRRVPEHDVHDAEPNYFPALEVDLVDLPWLYTSAKATANERLTPWCSLICLAESEIAEYRSAGTEEELAIVRVADTSVLPTWNQLWAWAHAQLSGDKTVTPAELAQILADEPQRVIARFLCPRHLEPQTAYRAFLVPTFERGRLAGLRREVPETLDGLEPAWDANSQDLDLPVLYEWRFQTGVAEDFEYLVRQLKAFVVPEDVGRRDMNVLNPGLGLPSAADYPLALEGALRAVGGKSTEWNEADRQAFLPSLTTLLNFPEDSLTTTPTIPIVAPPLYGRWHAFQQRLINAFNALPRWFHQLNADPRLRVTAALGTLVVQQQQRQLMASAWEQVGPIREINEEQRKKQLAKLTANRIYERHWQALDPESVLIAARPVLSRIQASPRTILSLIRESPVAPALFDPQLRRMTRPRGPVALRQNRQEQRQLPSLISRVNRGELIPRTQPVNPAGMVTPQVAGQNLANATLPEWLIKILTPLPRWLLLALFGLLLIFTAIGALPLVFLLSASAILGGLEWLRQKSGTQNRQTAIANATLSAEQVLSAPARPDFVPTLAPLDGAPPLPPLRERSRSRGESPSAASFRQAAAKALASARKPPLSSTDLIALDISTVGSAVITALDPNTTIIAGIRDRLHTGAGAVQPVDPVEEVMASPEFPQPMYEPLRDLGQDWLLPGLDKVPANSICLLETNQPFVEAYMLGLSHEMSRELLWNEYPTDQRGTYFRQFWDVRGYIPPANQTLDPEKLKDIYPIHTWQRNQGLGVNSSRQLASGGRQVVLLIRGDLLRRYPNTVIYAVHAAAPTNGKRSLGTEESHPIFRGILKPDVTFFGFDLTESQVRGSQTPGGDPGWFFVFQEQPAEPRFGLDLPSSYGGAPASWNDLSWGHLANDAAGLKAIKYIDLAAGMPDTAALETDANDPIWRAAGGPRGCRSSDIAYITLQIPARIAIHATEMMPAATGGTTP